MKNLTFLIKPASSLCNMRCKYCFYDDVSNNRTFKSLGIMDAQTAEHMLLNIENSVSDGDRITFVFQGGEPTLAGIGFFEDFAQRALKIKKDIRLSFALQTNGLVIDEDWCAFFKKYDFLVGVSMDILKSEHDRERIDSQGKGTYTRINRAISLLNKFGVRYNVLCTLTRAVARYPARVWNEICAKDISYTQFTPCIGEMGGDTSLYALTPKMFASFYKGIFPLWYADYKKGKYRSIKLFDDIVNLIVMGVPTSCGIDGKCRLQLVVEADGSVYPCDFYCSDAYLMGNICKDSISHLLASQAAKDFLNRKDTRPSICLSCRYMEFCGGYCARMRAEVCASLEDTYCGYRDFLDFAAKDFALISEDLKRKYTRSG